jgi:ABC-2 type transport system ATP-binding protein
LRREIGYLPGEVRFYTNLTGRQTAAFLSRARRADCAKEIERLAEAFDLDLDKTVRKYSSGMKQKLGLIQAMMHRPRLLILDEPTNGLDPLVRKSLFGELRQVVRDRRTVLFSSHTLSEVEELCDEVVIVREGRIVERQSISQLRGKAVRRVEAWFREEAAIPGQLPAALRVIERNSRRVVFSWAGPIGDLLDWLRGQSLVDVWIGPPSLEELFLTYYRQP